MTLLLLTLGAVLLAGCKATPTVTTLKPDRPTRAEDVPRYGLNLGGSGTWGAEQLRANVLTNPGFEAILDRTVIIVKDSDGRRIVNDTDWLARPDGFWSGATYDVRSGGAAGHSGKVLDSRKHADGFAEILLDPPPNGIVRGDVVVLTRTVDTNPAPGWWADKGRFGVATDDIRPGSPGRQSLRLLSTAETSTELLHYFDNIGDRAGKLLPVNGKWRLDFWALSRTPGARLHIHFDRGGHAVFLDAEIVPGSDWQHHVFEFEAQDDGPPAVLTLGLRASGGEVLLDDAYLGEAEAGAGGFRRVVVETLRGLRPGFLRDWQGQLGDTLGNRLAPEQGHRPARYRPGDHEAQFHYGLPDFLELCAAVEAQPWIVAPTTLDDAEWRRLGAYLRQAADAHDFHTLLVEFGNENWNAIFRPGGIPDAATHAAVADRAFRLLKEGSGNDPRLVPVANAQFVNPDSPRQIGALSREAARIAVAPYFLYRLDAGISVAAGHDAALRESGELIAQEAATARSQGKQLAVYEENFHTTLGNVDTTTRNAVVTGAASGSALARRLLQGTLAGLREQAVYSFSGFDSYLQEGKGLVQLWGITRDLTEADRLRPTGIALGMLNRVAGGNARGMKCSGADCGQLTAVAFDEGRLSIVSAAVAPLPLAIELSCPAATLHGTQLDGGAASNGQGLLMPPQAIEVTCQKQRIHLTLPPLSLTVIHP